MAKKPSPAAIKAAKAKKEAAAKTKAAQAKKTAAAAKKAEKTVTGEQPKKKAPPKKTVKKTLPKPKALTPKIGDRYSIYFDDTDTYHEVTITAANAKKKTVEFELVGDDSGDLWDGNFNELEPSLQPSVETRFGMYEDLANLALSGDLKALLITGQAGLGKSHTVEQCCKNFTECEVDPDGGSVGDFVIIKGKCTPLSLYKQLYHNSDKTIIFDDCDSVTENATSNNILKAVLDTKEVRKVSWLSTAKALDDVPQTFEFTGQIIFISNKLLHQFDKAVLSRSVILDLFMTNPEIIDRMRMLLPVMRGELSKAKADEILKIISKYKNSIVDLNLRTFTKAINTYLKTDSLSTTQYQIIATSLPK